MFGRQTKKSKKFRKGDKVIIMSEGEGYTTYDAMAKTLGVFDSYCKGYGDEDTGCPVLEGKQGIIVGGALHHMYNDYVYAVAIPEAKYIMLFGEEGLGKLDMTILDEDLFEV